MSVRRISSCPRIRKIRTISKNPQTQENLKRRPLRITSLKRTGKKFRTPEGLKRRGLPIQSMVVMILKNPARYPFPFPSLST